MNIAKGITYSVTLAGLFFAAAYLPALVQKSPKFKPLAESISKSLPQAPAAPAVPEPVVEVTPPLRTVSSSEIRSSVPAPATPVAPQQPDITPFVDAMASADFVKADAVLDLLKPLLPEGKFVEYKAKVTKARATESERAQAAAVAASRASAAMPKMDDGSTKALAESQTAIAEALKQLQTTQAETAKVVAELKSRPAVAAPESAATKVAAAAPVVASGTSLPGTVTIRFGYDSSLIDPAEGVKIAPALKVLLADSKLKAEIRGYADKKGDSTYNLGLSNARAQAVKDSLRASGVENARISIVPFGSFGAAANAKPEDMRKVEILLVK